MLNLEDMLKCFDNVFKQTEYLFESPAVTAKKHEFTKFFFL